MFFSNFLKVIFVIFLVFFLIFLAILIPVLIANWKLYKKAGKRGWESLIPIYSTWVLIEISGLHWCYFFINIILIFTSLFISDLAYYVSMASLYINFIIYYNLAKRMKQDGVLYGILAIFVPIIPVLVLGFSKSIQYDKNIEVKPNALF